jgi:hypothetical protein
MLTLSDGIAETFNQSVAMLGEIGLCKLMQKLNQCRG